MDEEQVALRGGESRSDQIWCWVGCGQPGTTEVKKGFGVRHLGVWWSL